MKQQKHKPYNKIKIGWSTHNEIKSLFEDDVFIDESLFIIVDKILLIQR